MGETKVRFHPVKSLFGRMKHSPLLCIDGAFNGNVVNDASLEVMLRIEKEIHRLHVEGGLMERRMLTTGRKIYCLAGDKYFNY